MKDAAKFLIAGRESSDQPLHYQVCGLDDVYLLNGYTYHRTKHGDGIAVENVELLHQVIGMYLITNRKVLSRKDLKFLRKDMGLTQDELAEQLGTMGQNIARYEKGQTDIPGPVDKLIRFVYALSIKSGNDSKTVLNCINGHMIDLKEVDESSDEPVYFDKDQTAGWKRRKRSPQLLTAT